jgi:His-Xaa-Ser repeat protein HxsA
MRKRTFLIPSLLAAGFGAHDPAQAGLIHATTTGHDDPDKGDLLRQFGQDHLVTLAQHRSHSSHSSHRSGSGGGGHYSHTSHRSSAGGYDPYYPPPPVYPAPAPPPPPPPIYPTPSRVRATPPSGDPLPAPGAGAQRASPPGSEALPALSGRTQRFAAIVRRVQIALMAQGFFHGPITGNVGPVTRAALRQFQQARGLGVTGTITPQTLDALMISSE